VKTSEELRIDPEKTALLIIDMQNDFLDPAGYFGHLGLAVENLRRAVEPTRQLRAALPSGVKVIYTVQVYESDGSDDLWSMHQLKPAGLRRSGSDIPAVRGSWGAQIVPALEPAERDLVVVKRRFDAFYQTDLELLLRCWGVKTVIVSGVVADVCVETSLRSAYVRDFDVVFARDCVGGWKEEHLLHTMDAVERSFGVCMGNAEILRSVGSR
jgi:ureidoacrylate peracid hydrolase